MLQSYMNKVAEAYKSAGDKYFYGFSLYELERRETLSLSQLKTLLETRFLLEGSDQFASLTAEEQAQHHAICEKTDTALAAYKAQFGEKAVSTIKLSIALELAYPNIARDLSHPNAQIEAHGLHGFKHLPLIYFTAKHVPEDASGHITIADYEAQEAVVHAYADTLNRLANNDPSIPAITRAAFKKLDIEPTALNEHLHAFVAEYRAVAERCKDPLTEENAAFIVAALPENRQAAAKDALEYVRNFPQKPTLRDANRLHELRANNHQEKAALPAFPPKADAITSGMYYSMVSQLIFGETPKLAAIKDSVKALAQTMPNQKILYLDELNKTLDYCTTAYEKVAYANKFANYEYSKLSSKEQIYQISEMVLQNRSRFNRVLNIPRYAQLTPQDHQRIEQYLTNKAAFTTIHEALLFDEPTNASVDTLQHARAYLHSLMQKTTEVVTAISNSKEPDYAAWDDEEDDDQFEHKIKAHDIGASWRKKLNDSLYQSAHHYPSVSAYAQALPESMAVLELMDQKITRMEQRAEETRRTAIAETTYDPDHVLIVNKVPNTLRQDQSDRIDAQAVATLQDELNTQLTGMKKTYFSVLEKPPLLRIEAKKNKLVISIEQLGTQDVMESMRKLFSKNPERIDEALTNGQSGVLRAVKDILKSRYRFINDTDFVTPVSNASQRSASQR